MRARLTGFLLGGADFGEDEEYFCFQFRVLHILLAFGIFSSASFLAGHFLGQNLMGHHAWVLLSHVGLCMAFMVFLHGRKDRFRAVAVAYAGVCAGVLVAALVWVPHDELRVLWFPVSLPAVYLLLGPRVGAASLVGMVALILALNPFLVRPYSGTALMTFVMGLVSLGVLFHAFASRSISYHERLVASRERLRRLAQEDPLTGLFNARAYYEAADRMLVLAARTGAPCAAIFVDLDHFKRINDTWGHEAGDAVLRQASACLAGHLRVTDLLGRIGGEEFAILLPDTDLPGALHLAEKLRRALEALQPEIGDRRLRVTASLGVALREPRHRTLHDLQREADQAMYQAKAEGRNRVTCFSAGACPG